VITAGGTIENSFCERSGELANIDSKIERYLAQIRLPHTRVEVLPILAKDRLDLCIEDRQLILTVVRQRFPLGCPIVITHGTDTVLQTAQELERNLPELDLPIIFTGAMTPLGFDCSDGIQNLTESLLAAKLLPPGVHLVMHSTVFNIHEIRKDHDRATFVHADGF